jgi:hypothetical protein
MSQQSLTGMDRPSRSVFYSKIIALVAIRRTVMSVFKKQGVYWFDDYVNGHRKRERIGPDTRLLIAVLG